MYTLIHTNSYNYVYTIHITISTLVVHKVCVAGARDFDAPHLMHDILITSVKA